MSNIPSKQRRKEAIGNYCLAIASGLMTLTLGTIAINFGFIPLLPVQHFGPDEWTAALIIALTGLGAFETGINFCVFFERVVEHRKQSFADRKKRS